MMQFRKRIRINDVDLNYYEKGVGKIVILLHGNGMDSISLSKMFEKLSEKYRTIAIDTRAQGFSSEGDKKLSIQLFADDIINFCKQKSLSHVSIIGYSDGANIALLVAKNQEGLIKNMVLISGNFKVCGICFWFRLLLILYKIVLKPFKIFSKHVCFRIELIDLMLSDIEINEEQLRKIKIKTLVLCARLEVVKSSHTKLIYNLMPNSGFKLIRFSNHANIIKKTRTISTIVKFLDENSN